MMAKSTVCGDVILNGGIQAFESAVWKYTTAWWCDIY